MPLHDVKCKDCNHIATKLVQLNSKNEWRCEKCNSSNVFIYFGNFKTSVFNGITYFKDIDNYGEPITSSQIDKKCKEKGLVYGTQDEISREAARYRAINKKESDARDQKVVDKIESEFAKRLK